MKIKLLIFLLLITSTPSFAQHDFRLLVGLNMKDCIDCIAGKLDQIAGLNQSGNDLDIDLVIGRQFIPDSALIIKKYNLYGISKHIIWSDKLLNKITNGESSAILFSSKYNDFHAPFYVPESGLAPAVFFTKNNTLTFHSLVKTLPDYMISYMKRASLPDDSLFPAYPNITLGLYPVNVGNIFINRESVYLINSLANTVDGYDLFTNKKVFDFTIPDSILKETFAYSGLPDSIWALQYHLMQRARNTPYMITGLAFNGDTVFVKFINRYIVPDQGDSAIKNDNILILKVVNGRVNHIYRFTPSFRGQDKQLYFSEPYDFCYYDRALYNFISVMPNTVPYKPYSMMGRFEADSQRIFKPTKLSAVKNPIMYRYLACEKILFDGGYFSIPQIDSLFSLTGAQPNISLGSLPPYSHVYTITNPCSSGMAIRAFKVTDSIIWVMVQQQNGDSAIGTAFRYNRITKEVSRSKTAFSDIWSMQIAFDPVDPDFIIYTKGGSNRLYRKKMF